MRPCLSTKHRSVPPRIRRRVGRVRALAVAVAFALGGTPLGLMIYVENVNEAFPRALKAGAKELKPLTDEFWGDRAGSLLDPFGHRWMIATHMRDVSEAEMQKAIESMSASG